MGVNKEKILIKDLLGIKNDNCPNCGKKIIKAKALAENLIFCDFECYKEWKDKEV